MAQTMRARLSALFRGLKATPRRRRLLLVASLVPGVVLADIAVSVWKDPVMLGVGVILVVAAVLAQLRLPPGAARPQPHQEPRP